MLGGHYDSFGLTRLEGRLVVTRFAGGSPLEGSWSDHEGVRGLP